MDYTDFHGLILWLFLAFYCKVNFLRVILTTDIYPSRLFCVFLNDMKKTILPLALFCFVAAASAQHIPKLKMTDVVRSYNATSDSIYVINFWATFCKPCVAEIPGFIKTVNKYKKDKVKLELVSLDLPLFYPNKIAAFATKNNFKTNLAWLDETDADYFCPMIDKSWSGAIPATIIVNAKTGYKKFFEGDMKEEDFEKELKKAIADTKVSLTDPKFVMPMNGVVAVDYYDKENPSRNYRGQPNAAITFKSKDSTVFSVGGGVVTTVFNIEDFRVVIIKRNKIFYTYSNLKAVLVKKGDKINANQLIGYAGLDLEKTIPTIDFYLSNDTSSIYLTRENFKSREDVNSIRFSPMLGVEPE